jgi:SNF2 family DNA or RNA helicase
MRFAPRAYQERMIRRLVERKRNALFVDMGLGKTACVLAAIKALELCALVVGPKAVIESTWPAEIRKWELGLRYEIIFRHNIPSAVSTLAAIHAISYDNLMHLCAAMPQSAWPWDLVVFDESSKMKNPTSKRMRSVRKVLHHFERRVILSGTPALEGYGDLWSQIYLLDDGARLGAFVSHFRANYMEPADWQGWSYRLKQGAAAKIEAKIADLVLCLKSEDYLDLPPLVVRDHLVELPPKARESYRKLEKDLFMQLDSKNIEAVNAAALSGKCCQLASGAVYDKGRSVAEGHDAKLAKLVEIVEDAQGSPVIVCYQYQHELERLRTAFPQSRAMKGAKDIADWNARRIPVLLCHPASCGHGLNLQDGGHILVWYAMPWSGDQYMQMPKRLHRPGQGAASVIVHRILARRTIDEAKVLRVEGKLEGQDGLLEALKAYRATVHPLAVQLTMTPRGDRHA